jgi:hypothetical protein
MAQQMHQLKQERVKTVERIIIVQEEQQEQHVELENTQIQIMNLHLMLVKMLVHLEIQQLKFQQEAVIMYVGGHLEQQLEQQK